MDLQARRVVAEGRDRCAPRDDDGALWLDSGGSRHERSRRLRESEGSEPLELGCSDHGPYRDHGRDDATCRGRDDTGPLLERVSFATAPARLAQNETKSDIGGSRERETYL